MPAALSPRYQSWLHRPLLREAHRARKKHRPHQPQEASNHPEPALPAVSQPAAFLKKPLQAAVGALRHAQAPSSRVLFRPQRNFPPSIFSARYPCRRTRKQDSGSASGPRAWLALMACFQRGAAEVVEAAEEVASWPPPAASTSAPAVFPRAWVPASFPRAAERVPPSRSHLREASARSSAIQRSEVQQEGHAEARTQRYPTGFQAAVFSFRAAFPPVQRLLLSQQRCGL